MPYPIILAGGIGSRLWPVSTPEKPKQYLNLAGELTLLQQAVLRAQVVSNKSPVIVASERHQALLAEQLQAIDCDDSRVILEPCGRNTAPAIALAALDLLAKDSDPLMLILPADHQIINQNAFADSVKQGVTLLTDKLATGNQIIAFGVTPTSANCQFGYIKRGRRLVSGNPKISLHPIELFVEKPNASLAKDYLQSGHYVWNSGIYLIKARRYLEALEDYRPDILSCVKTAFEKAQSDKHRLTIPLDDFQQCPSESIDYAVMEKCDNGIVVSLDAGWRDIGGGVLGSRS